MEKEREEAKKELNRTINRYSDDAHHDGLDAYHIHKHAYAKYGPNYTRKQADELADEYYNGKHGGLNSSTRSGGGKGDNMAFNTVRKRCNNDEDFDVHQWRVAKDAANRHVRRHPDQYKESYGIFSEVNFI